jgi:hypothetical protein
MEYWDAEAAWVDLQENNVVTTPVEKVGNLSDLTSGGAVDKPDIIERPAECGAAVLAAEASQSDVTARW